MIRGAIFDFDGTLFDSMSIWETAGEDYLRSVGRVAAPDLQATLKTMSLYQSACYLKEAYRLGETVEAIMGGVNRVVEDFYFHAALPKPGVTALLQGLERRGVALCVATATDRYQVEAALKRCGMEQFFRGILTCTDVGYGKDRPEIFRQALQLLRTDRRDTVVVEDAYHAIQTAKADGFTTVGVYDPYEPRHQEILNMADLYLADYTDLEGLWALVAGE